MRQVIALSLALAASPATAAHCPHGQLYRVSMGKCVAIGSPLAIAYQSPTHWLKDRIYVEPPADIEPLTLPIEVTVPGPDPDIIDIPLTDPDPAQMALKQQLEKK